MSGVEKKLGVLSDDVNWFACATELRMHVVLADEDLREPVLRIVLRGSRVTDRPTPYLTCLGPHAGPDAGWTQRVQIVDEARAKLTEELGLRGTTVRPSSLPAVAQADLGAFAVRVLELASATAPACAPPVVVLAPESVEQPERFQQELELLVSRQELAAIRWVVVLPDDTAVRRLITRLGSAAMVTDCRTTPAEALAFLKSLVANAEGAPATAAPMAVLGMAWPRVTPPRRRDLAGNPIPTYTPTPEDEARRASRLSVMRGAAALAAQSGPEAVQQLRAAVDQLARAGLVDEGLMVWLVLATTLATLGDRRLACRELDAVTQEAKRLAKPSIAAQAANAKAALLAAARETHAAIEAYADAIASARAAGPDAVPLLIEMLRAAGQYCLTVKQDERGVACFREALAVAEAAPPSVSAGAADVALALAELCRKRGLHQQAASLEAQAEQVRRDSLTEAAPVATEEPS